jgi:hypothetical protein
MELALTRVIWQEHSTPDKFPAVGVIGITSTEDSTACLDSHSIDSALPLAPRTFSRKHEGRREFYRRTVAPRSLA